MGKIRVLPEKTINQIAAGEVVENPASVVKEVVENSIDAGASEIVVEIEGGGFQLIRVSDDGCGMLQDDAILSLERHATSKIATAEDLSTLQTMGFRGEALASIGAISHLTLSTSVEGREGIRISSDGNVGPCARKRGTTVEVRSLFYNVPARKKFQKSAAASTAEVHRLLILLALSHPEIGFVFFNNGSEIFFVKPSMANNFLISLQERASAVLGPQEVSAIDIQEGSYRFYGLFGAAAASRLNRSGQHLFLNRRLITAPPISFAVKDGYGTRLDIDRHPVFVLHIEAPAHLVDVNVHPQKKEVRFQEESILKESVRRAVHRSFGYQEKMPLAPFTATPFADFPLTFQEERGEAPALFTEELFLQPLGVFDHYLLLDQEEGIAIIDLLAAQEAIAFAVLSKKEKGALSQPLLLPVTVELSREEAVEVERRLAEIASVGFSVQRIGPQAFSIEAVPPFLAIEQLPDVLHALGAGDEKIIPTVARFARAQKRRFMVQEAIELARKILRTPPPYLSPSGERIVVTLGRHAIEKLFH